MKVSVITTLKNEAGSVGELIDSLLKQSRQPDEIIITDGGSTDGTIEIIQSYIDKGAPVKFIVVSGNRSVGRNAAAAAAEHDIIACTDAGVKLDLLWLSKITAPFKDPTVDVVSGFTSPNCHTFFEKCVSVINLLEAHEVDPEKFLPSSRSVAFLKSAWAKAGGYPEWMNLNEDTPFNLRLVKAGCKFKFEPEALVYWKPTGSFTALYRQFYNYARGDGQGNIYTVKYYLIQKCLIYLMGLIFLGLGFVNSIFWIILLACMGLYFIRPLRKGMRLFGDTGMLLYLPAIIVTRDVAEMKGFARGIWERFCHPQIFNRE